MTNFPKRNHVMVCATASVLALFGGSIARAANLLVNPTFEAPPGVASVDSTVAGWTLLENAQRANFVNNTPGGSRSIWFKTFQPIGGGVQQSVGISAGGSYTFSAFNRFETAYPTTEAVVFRQVEWLNAGGSLVSMNRFDILPTDITNTMPAGPNPVNTWLPFSSVVTAPAGSTMARITLGWEGGGTVSGAQSAFVDDIVFDGPGTPPVPIGSDWVPNSSGDYNIINNWANGVVPNGIGATANFLGAISSPRTVYSDAADVVGTLKFDNASQYVLAGSGSLTMDVASGNAAINVVQGSHKINLPFRLNDSTVATVAAGATLTIADPLTLANGSTLTKSGAGTLEIISTVTTLASGAIITNGGVTNLRLDLGATTAIQSAGGETRVFATERVANVKIDAGTVSIDSAGPLKILKTTGINFTGATPQGKLDVGDNAVIDQYSGASPTAAIRAAIISGRAGGNGIVTTASTANRSIGYAASTQIGSPTTFLGESFTGSAVLIRYTLTGDADLTGNVNFDDLVPLAQNYNGSGKEWFQGDFTYDGVVNFDDLVPLAQNYNGTLNTSALTDVGGASFAADFALARALVPEPTSLALLGVAGAAMLGRRRLA